MNKIRIQTILNKGRCVIANRDIAKGEIICECPVIVIPGRDTASVRKTILDTYIFSWPGDKQTTKSKRWSRFCIPLGPSSLINHSKNPNSHWMANTRAGCVSFYAKKDIPSGREITHDYHWPKRMTVNFEE